MVCLCREVSKVSLPCFYKTSSVTQENRVARKSPGTVCPNEIYHAIPIWFAATLPHQKKDGLEEGRRERERGRAAFVFIVYAEPTPQVMPACEGPLTLARHPLLQSPLPWRPWGHINRCTYSACCHCGYKKDIFSVALDRIMIKQ